MAKQAMPMKQEKSQGEPVGANELLPLGRRERMPSDGGDRMSDHNNRGNSNLRGKNLAHATRKHKG